jgi:hypothetical protein
VAARKRLLKFGACAGGAALLAALALWLLWPDPGDPRLRAYVHSLPPVPVVFTSRTEPVSFVAPAPEGDGYTYPGKGLWQAREGRLRLLTPRGTVHELTWGRQLPDGGTLIDVMSPSISLDGSKILFAGRKGPPDQGRFRLYEVGVDGSNLRALTGGPDDAGCIALPPMRYGSAGTSSLLSEQQRKAVDYDDVDPVPLPYDEGRIAFVSSRMPDLGRGHARRSTTLWTMELASGEKQPLTANRNNDRWPFMTAGGVLSFSLWSRNVEVLTQDERDIRPYDPRLPWATRPTDTWMGAFVKPVSAQFGALVKTSFPVWRARPLFNGRIVFMTSLVSPSSVSADEGPGVLRVMQADPGLLANAPSSVPAGLALPRQEQVGLWRGPDRDVSGRPLSLATPSPCPGGQVLLAGAVLDRDASVPRPGSYGLYMARDGWETADVGGAVGADRVGLRLLFDDPDLVDAEPVAVYRRPLKSLTGVGDGSGPRDRLPRDLTLAGGVTYHGQAGAFFNGALYASLLTEMPGQRTDRGEGPVFDAPPKGSLSRIRIYASRRDRFDDPVQPRIPGSWELLVEAPTHGEGFGAEIPVGIPTVLAGFDADGRVVRWSPRARDSQGRRATFYAFAGDHYSGARPGGKHFCIGCHPGHSTLSRDAHRHAERLP